MAKIIDQYGKPFDLGEIAEPQTASIAALQHQMIESHLDGLTPADAARILRDADQGDLSAQATLFDDMYDRDAHLRCEIDKRSGAIVGLNWSIQPPQNATAAEKADAAWLDEILRYAVDDLEDLITAMMDAVGHGFSPVELEWQMVGKERIPVFHPRPQTWFRTDRTRRELRLNDGSGDGAVPVSMGWIIHQPRKIKTGYLGRAGLFRAVLWPFLYKAYSIGDFAEFLEIYGLPIIMGKYMGNPNKDEKASLMRAVTMLGRDARAIMPESMQIEIAKVAGGSGDGGHLSMVDWADGAQSKAILGQVLSAEAKATGMGSGVADLHASVRKDIRLSDARQMAGTLTRDLIYPMLVFNRPGIDSLRRCPRWSWDIDESDDMTPYAENLPKLASGGMRIPLEWVHKRLRIPQADEKEAIFSAAVLDKMPVGTAALKAAPTTTTVTVPDTPATQADRLAADTANAMADLIAEIGKIVAAAASMEALYDDLLNAYGNLDSDALTQILALGFAAADLAGMVEASTNA